MGYVEDIEAEPNTAADPSENRFLPVLETIVELLDDGYDHPEVWEALAQAAQQDDVGQVSDLIVSLLPHQPSRPAKILETIAAVLHALSRNHAEGLASLGRLSAENAHCPQIAGAFFFVHRAAHPTKSADLSDRFCEAPFVKFETLMDGEVAPCCSIWTQKRLGRLDNQSFEEIWNSADAQAMRASILDGSYRYCNKQRCTLIMDDHLPKRDEVTDPELRAVIEEGRT